MVDQQEEKKQRVAKWLTWILGLAGVGLLTPLLLKGLIGLMSVGAALIVTWVIVMLVTQLLPLGRVMLANWVMKAYQWEASRNPIETMLNDHMQQTADLAAFNRETTEIDKELHNFSDLVAEAEQVAPESPATIALRKQRDDIAEMVVDLRRQSVEFQRGLNAYAKEIEIAKVIWKASQAGLRIFKRLGFSKKRVYQKIMRETAIASVKSSLNQMRAELATRRNQARERLHAALDDEHEVPDVKALSPKREIVSLPPVLEKERIPR